MQNDKFPFVELVKSGLKENKCGPHHPFSRNILPKRTHYFQGIEDIMIRKRKEGDCEIIV